MLWVYGAVTSSVVFYSDNLSNECRTSVMPQALLLIEEPRRLVLLIIQPLRRCHCQISLPSENSLRLSLSLYCPILR